MLLIYIFSVTIGIFYFTLILLFLWGWGKTGIVERSICLGKTTVSVVIAVRNEAANIPALIRALKFQDYPKDLVEVLFVDDHSTDATKEAIHFCLKGETGYSIIPNSGIGKKDALQCGYKECRGDLIITTDADCTFTHRWISSLVSFYECENPDLIVGPVILDEGPGILQDLQALEFLSLTGTSGGSAGIGRPVLCNGANLAFNRKKVVPDSEDMNPQFASGDDIFLLHYIKKMTGLKSLFLKSREAVVISKGEADLRSFWNQRKRWTSKSRAYRDSDSVITAMIVYIMNLLLLASLILTIFIPQMFLVFFGLFMIKSVPDFLFMYAVSDFFNRKHLLRYFLILQILYFFYVSIIPVAGTIGKFSWKNRVYK
jgi:glycosyltransferase involved in cell wall biosynthesis